VSSEPRSERGNVSLIVPTGVALAIVLCLGVARVGGAVSLRARADNAADAAALAAADSLALGRSPSLAEETARRTASDNGARYVSGRFESSSAEIVVRIDHAEGYARAVVDLNREPALEP
jgi:secretion/DNA translocation related TadE-like protein